MKSKKKHLCFIRH
uniref:Uncharacterized protein n=1 Tax=Arundo donax TaxID=35708 RepID=A0A0A8YLY1_ARUDO